MHAELVEGLVERIANSVHKTIKHSGVDPDESPKEFAEVLQQVIDDLTVDLAFLLEDEE